MENNREVQERPEQRPSLYDLFVGSVREFAIFLLDSQGPVGTWNEGARHTWGYTADESIGRHFSLPYTKDDLAASVPQKELNTGREQAAQRRSPAGAEGGHGRVSARPGWVGETITATVSGLRAGTAK